MRGIWEAGCAAVTLVALAVAAWMLGLGGAVRESVAAGHVGEWTAAILCLFWLLIVLKVPWDLYFQAHSVLFEMELSREKGIPVPESRRLYVLRLRLRLAWLSVGLHLVSAAAAVIVAAYTGSPLAYWIAAVFAISTAFRPAAAGYEYLSRKLAILGGESRYPREDAAEMREQLRRQEQAIRNGAEQMDQLQKALNQESDLRQTETRQLRQAVSATGRELEQTVSRLTDNQEVIRGIQAFVRLIAQSTQSPAG